MAVNMRHEGAQSYVPGGSTCLTYTQADSLVAAPDRGQSLMSTIGLLLLRRAELHSEDAGEAGATRQWRAPGCSAGVLGVWAGLTRSRDASRPSLAGLLAFSVCGVAVFVLVVAGIAMARRGSYVLLLRRSIVYVVGRVSVRLSVCLSVRAVDRQQYGVRLGCC